MYKTFHSRISSQLEEIRAAGTYKRERVIITPQGTMIRVSDGKPVLNLCANNYLGLAQHPAIAAAAKEALDKWGYGMASVRFICGTQSVHKHLEAKLREASKARLKLIATDGVFSMDGYIANLPAICDLAERHEALVMVDDSHAVGFMGKTGRGTHEHHKVMGSVDLLTGTLGKALGGASGGYTSGRKEIIELLRQRSRPYLFSNTLAPVIVAGSLKALELLSRTTDLRDKLEANTTYFREGMSKLGFN